MLAGTAPSARQGCPLRSRRSCLGHELAALAMTALLAVQGLLLPVEVAAAAVAVRSAIAAWVLVPAALEEQPLLALLLALPLLRLAGAALWSHIRCLAHCRSVEAAVELLSLLVLQCLQRRAAIRVTAPAATMVTETEGKGVTATAMGGEGASGTAAAAGTVGERDRALRVRLAAAQAAAAAVEVDTAIASTAKAAAVGAAVGTAATVAITAAGIVAAAVAVPVTASGAAPAGIATAIAIGGRIRMSAEAGPPAIATGTGGVIAGDMAAAAAADRTDAAAMSGELATTAGEALSQPL